jgi:DNA-binding XRE family transcriptional regulator
MLTLPIWQCIFISRVTDLAKLEVMTMGNNHKVDLEKIKKLRKEKGISLERMAEILGYESPNGYYYLECGRGKFPAEALSKVANELGVPITELFFDIKVAKMANIEQSATREVV